MYIFLTKSEIEIVFSLRENHQRPTYSFLIFNKSQQSINLPISNICVTFTYFTHYMNALVMHIIYICIVIWGRCLRNVIRQLNEALRLSLSVFLQYMQMSKYEYLLHVSCVLILCRLQKVIFWAKQIEFHPQHTRWSI